MEIFGVKYLSNVNRAVCCNDHDVISCDDRKCLFHLMLYGLFFVSQNVLSTAVFFIIWTLLCVLHGTNAGGKFV